MKASEVARDPAAVRGAQMAWCVLSEALSTRRGVALTGVGPVGQQQHADGLEVDVAHLFVRSHLDAPSQGSGRAEHTGGWKGRGGEGRGGEGRGREEGSGRVCMLCMNN